MNHILFEASCYHYFESLFYALHESVHIKLDSIPFCTELLFFEYRYFVRDFSLEMYLAVVAILFLGLGTWSGYKLLQGRKKENSFAQNVEIDKEKIKDFGISEREYEVLELLARGRSNNEIAEALFVSLNTVKTHISNLYSKMNVSRRTQAIQKARDLGIIN